MRFFVIKLHLMLLIVLQSSHLISISASATDIQSATKEKQKLISEIKTARNSCVKKGNCAQLDELLRQVQSINVTIVSPSTNGNAVTAINAYRAGLRSIQTYKPPTAANSKDEKSSKKENKGTGREANSAQATQTDTPTTTTIGAIEASKPEAAVTSTLNFGGSASTDSTDTINAKPASDTSTKSSAGVGIDKHADDSKSGNINQKFVKAFDDCLLTFGKSTINSPNGSTTNSFEPDKCKQKLCIRGGEFENAKECKKLNNDEDSDASCGALHKAYVTERDKQREICKKGPSGGEKCVSDYIDCQKGVLGKTDVYESVTSQVTELATIQSMLKPGNGVPGVPPQILNKCNALSGTDYLSRKEGIESELKTIKDDLAEAKEKYIKNQNTNAEEAKKIKEDIAETQRLLLENKNKLSQELREKLSEMNSRIASLAKQRQQIVSEIQAKNLEIMKAQNAYNNQMMTMNSKNGKSINCSKQVAQAKKELDGTSLGGNVGNSLNKRKALLELFNNCKKLIDSDLKMFREAYVKQKEMLETSLANLNSDLVNNASESENAKKEIEEFKVENAKMMTALEQETIQKTHALAVRQAQQAESSIKQTQMDQENIARLEKELQTKNFELTALGPPPADSKGDENAANVAEQIRETASKANVFYKNCCSGEDKDSEFEKQCKTMDSGGEGYKASKKGVEPVVSPSNSKGTSK